jgi:hypothetical protein
MLFYPHLEVIREQQNRQNPSLVARAFQTPDKTGNSVLTISVLSDMTRSHTDLVVENALLRQQLIVLI